MRLETCCSLWTNGFDLEAAITNCRRGLFDGVEGPVPQKPDLRREFVAKLRGADVPFIAEICTAGGYVPERRASTAEHLADFRRKAEESLEAAPKFLTVLAGCDAWAAEQSAEFFAAAIEVADRLGIVASFETHRSRSLFNPWITRDLLRLVPNLRLTCDFSHWCCVCERLVMDAEPDVFALCAERVQHIHARVGYDQGPQVPHPAAPEFREPLEAHERWWTRLWRAQLARDFTVSTITPEFGPDGYLHTIPFTNKPVADLAEINAWMAARQRERFALFFDAESNPKNLANS